MKVALALAVIGTVSVSSLRPKIPRYVSSENNGKGYYI